MGRKTEPGCVLVTRFSALGDVAMTLPVVYGACAANPATRFVMLTRRVPSRMFLDTPPNLTVEAVDLDRYRGVGGMWRLLDEMIRRHGVDTVVDLHDVLRTRLIRLFASMRGLSVSRIDKERKARRMLTRRASKTMIQLKPMMRRYREAFEDVHLEVAEPFHSLFQSGRAPYALFSSVTPPKGKEETWLAVAPFAAHAGKVYPEALMAKAVEHYASLPGFRIFIFGAGEKEVEAIERLRGGRDNVVSMARAGAGMEAELALMSHCDTMLAMDSANMHLASLVGLRTVSVWGATHPYTGFYGFRQDPADAVQLDMVCRPCSIFGNKPCRNGDYHCLNGISPQLIIARIDAKLKPKNHEKK